jgi:hypothetical protein
MFLRFHVFIIFKDFIAAYISIDHLIWNIVSFKVTQLFS